MKCIKKSDSRTQNVCGTNNEIPSRTHSLLFCFLEWSLECKFLRQKKHACVHFEWKRHAEIVETNCMRVSAMKSSDGTKLRGNGKTIKWALGVGMFPKYISYMYCK